MILIESCGGDVASREDDDEILSAEKSSMVCRLLFLLRFADNMGLLFDMIESK